MENANRIELSAKPMKNQMTFGKYSCRSMVKSEEKPIFTTLNAQRKSSQATVNEWAKQSALHVYLYCNECGRNWMS